jgi:hypothetical protein
MLTWIELSRPDLPEKLRHISLPRVNLPERWEPPKPKKMRYQTFAFESADCVERPGVMNEHTSVARAVTTKRYEGQRATGKISNIRYVLCCIP